jgi:hypothetical protein
MKKRHHDYLVVRYSLGDSTIASEQAGARGISNTSKNLYEWWPYWRKNQLYTHVMNMQIVLEEEKGRPA